MVSALWIGYVSGCLLRLRLCCVGMSCLDLYRGACLRGNALRFILCCAHNDIVRALSLFSRQALFLWLVRVINASLGKGEESLPFIGVLDIFGE